MYEEQFYCYEVSLVIKFSYTLYAYFVAACRPSYSEAVFSGFRTAKLFSLLKLFQQERGAGAEIDAEGEIELLTAAAGGALSQPALSGFYSGAQYIVAGKGVVIVGTKVGCAYSAETFAAFPDT